jgi:hypothetical protein
MNVSELANYAEVIGGVAVLISLIYVAMSVMWPLPKDSHKLPRFQRPATSLDRCGVRCQPGKLMSYQWTNRGFK